ncbi:MULTISPECIES: ParB/RepB/Spo0J family partition protein [Brevundimonas]|uniref:ParB/RepB/Spo0J family partition protein n=1 Tax=Brevundimonas TaxID=41275 RepID=UPI000F012A64|nr:ParB/RepB/Spo0J family partition protein [Brevundimonas lutea]
MSERQRGLGRGLSALMGADAPPPSSDVSPASAARETPIELLARNPDQPRYIFADDELGELAASIRERGVIQPILVRKAPSGEGWQIIAGERRWRAAQLAGLKTVPVVERDLDDTETLEVAVIENVQREDLNPLEEANAYALLMTRFGRTQDAVAGIVGKSRSHVANTLRLMNLPGPVQDRVLKGELSAGHARALIGSPEAESLAERIVAEGLNVRQTEALARRAAEGPKPKKPGSARQVEGSADIAALESDLGDALGLKVTLRDRGGQGELTLAYRDLEQLDEIFRRLMRS